MVLVDVSGSGEPTAVDLSVPGQAMVVTRSVLGVAVVSVRDTMAEHAAQTEWAEWAYREMLSVMASAPRAVVCDLTALVGVVSPDSVRVLLAALGPVRDWPGLPVAFACGPGRLRDALREAGGGLVVVAAGVVDALEAVLGHAPVVSVVERFPPLPASASAARALLARTCTRWGCSDHIDAATLVVSELVTNAVRHAGTDLEVRFAACRPVLRVAVRDHAPGGLRLRPADPGGSSGRGLLLVEALARSWGVLPEGEAGKVVWAVLDPRQLEIARIGDDVALR